jgi:hypothetical protein
MRFAEYIGTPITAERALQMAELLTLKCGHMKTEYSMWKTLLPQDCTFTNFCNWWKKLRNLEDDTSSGKQFRVRRQCRPSRRRNRHHQRRHKCSQCCNIPTINPEQQRTRSTTSSTTTYKRSTRAASRCRRTSTNYATTHSLSTTPTHCATHTSSTICPTTPVYGTSGTTAAVPTTISAAAVWRTWSWTRIRPRLWPWK